MGYVQAISYGGCLMGIVQAYSYEGCLMPHGSIAVILLPSPLFENVDILECKIRESFNVAINESTECFPRFLNGTYPSGNS